MIRSTIQMLGLFVACFAGLIVFVSLQPEPEWKIEPQNDGTVKRSIEDSKGDWIEIRIVTTDNQLVRHHYRDWQYRVHAVRYDPNTGEEIEHRITE